MRAIIIVLSSLIISCDTYRTVSRVKTEYFSGKTVTRIVSENQILYSGCCGCFAKIYKRKKNKQRELEFFSDCNCFNALNGQVSVRQPLKDGTIKRLIFIFTDTLVENSSKYKLQNYLSQDELKLIKADTSVRECQRVNLLKLNKFYLRKIFTIKPIDRKYSDVVDSTFQFSVFDSVAAYRKETEFVDQLRWGW